MNITKKRIIQIIPATGWSAVYAIEQDDGSYQPEASLLVCWALLEWIEHGKLRQGVVGFDAAEHAGNTEDSDGFLGYIGPGEGVEVWRKEARSYGEYLKRLGETNETKGSE